MQKISLLTLTVIATAALTAERFVTGAGVTSTAAGNSLGVTRSDAAVGEAAPVDVIGTAVVVAGGAVAVDGLVEVGADGKAVAKTAGVTVGRALTAAAVDGDRIEVLLIPN
ncbi:capsid cement protein [Rheinheimera baltica]|uniref:capsid cement protein n=1 Tax=Rheinheimera baltica TaxID=67576 RepID=UPI00040A7ADF|nr:capsid cement protein [Rheinheimera baltica]